MLSTLVTTSMPTFFFLFCFLHLLHAVQQSYPPTDYTMDCTQYHVDNAGYLCEPATPTCETLAYFHVQEGLFSDLNTIATQLFNAKPSAIAEASGLSSSTTDLKPDEGIYVPLTCTCNGNFTSHNITYSIAPGNMLFMLANSTFEGLTTCQAIQDANPNSTATNLQVGDKLVFPLRCACPSQEQKQRGIKLLVTYPVEHLGESISSVTSMFGIAVQEFLAANNFTNTFTPIFAATTVLLPFHEKPTRPSSMSILPPITIAPPPSPPTRPKKARVFVAVALVGGLVLLTLIVIVASLLWKEYKAK